MALDASFPEQDQAAWQALENWLSQDVEGQALLTRLWANPGGEGKALAEWLTGRSAQAPPRLFTYFLEGQIGRLVNIAQAGVVQIQQTQSIPLVSEPHRLPRDIDDFTGRHRELAKLTALLERAVPDAGTAAVIAVLAGMPGVGKSALAIRAAHRVKDRFPEAQLYIDLRGDEGRPLDSSRVLQGFLRALGIADQIIPPELEERSGLYRSRLAGKRALVLLDNAYSEIQVRPLLPGSSTCAVLVTSRKRLSALEGASVFELPEMSEQEALSLLRRLVGGKRVKAEPRAAEKIIGLCGLLPLAIRIAGGKLGDKPHWKLGSYASQLADEQQRLERLQLGDLSIRSSFALSYRDLTLTDAHAFRLLGVLNEAEFPLEPVAALLGTDQQIAWEIMERLVDLQFLEPVGERRYRFHDLMHLFAREQAEQEEPGESRWAARQRIARSYALHQLPPDIPDFTGRGEDVNRLLSLLDRVGGAAAISGMGGIGKTTLAIHVAHRLSDRYPDARIWVDLRGTSQQPLTSEQAMSYIIHVLHPDIVLPREHAEMSALYYSMLTRQRVLIVLDNAGDAAQVRPLVPPPSCGLLVTSRQRLALPELRLFNLDTLTEEEARAVLVRVMGEGRASEEELTALAELCGQLPLALRVAGGFLAVHPDWTAAKYVQALADERVRLARLELGDLDVGAVLELSVRQLARENQDLAARWQTLSVFPAPFEPEAVAAVWGVDNDEARDGLSLLAERSLLFYDVEGGRYRLHDLMRMIAQNASYYVGEESKPTAEQQWEMAISRHAMYYLEVGGQAEDKYRRGGKYMLEGLRQFDVNWPQLQTAWARMRERKDETSARWLNRFPDRMAYTLSFRLAPGVMVSILEDAIAAARHLGDRRNEGYYLGNLGLAYAGQREVRHAIEYLEQALQIAREIRDHRNEGVWLGNLGDAYRQLTESHQAIEHFEQALRIAREIGDRRNEGVWLGNLGLAYTDLGRKYQAIECFDFALEITREVGDRRNEGIWLGNLGLIYTDLGDTPPAVQYSEQALEVAREIGDRRNETLWLCNLGLIYLHQGHWDEALQMFETALSISHELGERQGAARAINNLGLVYLNLGRLDDALQMFQKALTVFRELDDRQSTGKAYMNLGNVYLQMVRWDEATQMFQGSLAVSRELGDRSNEGTTLMNLGNVYLQMGHWDEAVRLFEESLEIAHSLGDRPGEERVLNNLALTYANQGRWLEAIQMFKGVLEIARSLDDHQGEGRALMNIGLLYLEQNQSEVAVTHWREALSKLHPDSPEYRKVATWL